MSHVHCPCHAAAEKRVGDLLEVIEALVRQYRDTLAVGGFTGTEPTELRKADEAIHRAKAAYA